MRKIKRLSITLTSEALGIYNSIKPHDRSKFVSDAIIEKKLMEEGQFTPEQETRIRAIVKEVVK